ncbi:MAG TPA: flavodoxin family protein [Oscillospiraceae bacterium]|nr:flavodoxin family protein [Oscillospiraceae bacterium]
MKMLMLNASPHKGNTWSVMCAIREEILRIKPDVEFDEVQISELNLPFCLGCSRCFRKGMSNCPHYTIMKDIITNMEESDGLILGATTYNIAPNALAKNFIDHLCFFMHRPHFFRNKAIVVSTTGGVFADKTVKYLAGTLLSIGYNRCYRLPIAAYSWNSYRPNNKQGERIKKITQKFYKDVASEKLHSPSVGIMIPYNLFRGMSLGYVKGTEYETEDGNFWTQPSRANCTYDPTVKVPFYKKVIGNLFYIIGKKASKSVTVTYKK